VTPVLKPTLTPIAIAIMLLISSGVTAQEPIKTMDAVEVSAQTGKAYTNKKNKALPTISEEVARTEQISQAEIQASGATNVLVSTAI